MGEDAGEEVGRDLAHEGGDTTLEVEGSGGVESPGFDEMMGEGEGVDGGELEGGADGERPVWGRYERVRSVIEKIEGSTSSLRR